MKHKLAILLSTSLMLCPVSLGQSEVDNTDPADATADSIATEAGTSSLGFEASVGWNSHEWGSSDGVLFRGGVFLPHTQRGLEFGLEAEYITGYGSKSETEFYDASLFDPDSFGTVEVDREYGHDNTKALFAVVGIGTDQTRIAARIGYHSTELKNDYSVSFQGSNAQVPSDFDTQNGWAAGASMVFFFGKSKKNGIRLDVTETKTKDVQYFRLYEDGSTDEKSGQSTLVSFSYTRKF